MWKSCHEIIFILFFFTILYYALCFVRFLRTFEMILCFLSSYSRFITFTSTAIASSFVLSSNINNGTTSKVVSESTFSLIRIWFITNKTSSIIEYGERPDGIKWWYFDSTTTQEIQWLLHTASITKELSKATDSSSWVTERRECLLSKCISLSAIFASTSKWWSWCSLFV